MKKITFLLVILVLAASCTQNKVTSDAYSQKSKLIYDSSQNQGLEIQDNQGGEVGNVKYATIETSKGTIKAELYTEKAPVTTSNFIELSNRGFYNGLIFHRVEPGFVVQGGDPKGDGTGGSEKTIPLEIVPQLKHVKGALGMARSQDPNSASSQFYITLDAAHFLDGSYAVFGKVAGGMDVVENLEVGDKMIKITISDK